MPSFLAAGLSSFPLWPVVFAAVLIWLAVVDYGP